MLVDTSVWIDFFNGHPSAAAERLARAISEGEPISLHGLVVTEILLGLKDDAQARKVLDLLGAFDAVPELTRDDYAEAARLYRQCRAKGFTIRSTIDCLIARLCLRDDLMLLAKDRDFEAIAKCVGLRLVRL